MKKLVAAALCLFVGGIAIVFLLRNVDRVADLGPHGRTLINVAILTFISAFGVAGALLWWWCGPANPSPDDDINPGANAETRRLGLKAGVYGLHPGVTYRVVREIKDHYGEVFPVGTELTFVRRNYLPYHGGHTVVFRPQPIYLQDETNADVLNALDAYLEVAGPLPAAGRLGR